VQIAAQCQLANRLLRDLDELVSVIHQVVKRNAGIDARCWQQLEERAVLVVCWIVVAAAAEPSGAYPWSAGLVAGLITSFDRYRVGMVV